MHIAGRRELACSRHRKANDGLSQTPKETTMNTRILTIAAAAAIALSAAGFNATASAAPLGMASQSIAQSTDSPIIQVAKKGGGHKGKWHGKHGKHGNWHGHKTFYPKTFHYGLYPAPYYYGGCLQQVKTWNGYALINVCQ
jgi:hypothetical protein